MNIYIRIIALACVNAVLIQAFNEFDTETNPWTSKREIKLAGKRHKSYLEHTEYPTGTRGVSNLDLQSIGMASIKRGRIYEPYYYQQPGHREYRVIDLKDPQLEQKLNAERVRRTAYVQQLQGKIRMLEGGSILGRMRNWIAQHMGSEFEQKLWARK